MPYALATPCGPAMSALDEDGSTLIVSLGNFDRQAWKIQPRVVCYDSFGVVKMGHEVD